MATSNSHLLNAFMTAKREFLASQKDCSLFDRVSNVTSIQEIHEFVMQFQAQQSNTTGMRCLRKINNFLERLRQLSEVIEVFVSVKPDVLALIWGPIKLLLQMANATIQSFDAIVDTMAIIGDRLPLFEEFTTLFQARDRVKDALILFYKDILDFFGIALNFLSVKHWKLVFESVWPKHRSKIDVVVSNIERHSFLLRDEVNLTHISEAHQARLIDFDRWAATFEFQARQNYNELETFISPRLYDDELDRFQRNMCERTGRWIQRDKAISKWLDPNDTKNRLIWLQGIPGAGKSYLSSMIVEMAKTSRTAVLFAFLSYKQGDVSAISIIHSLIFQLVIGAEGSDEALRADMRIKLFDIYRSSQRSLKSNTKFARETLCTLLNCVGSAHIIIDGLDELTEGERAPTLREILSISRDANETKTLISSRMEDDISRIMSKTVHKAVRVDDQNGGCIQSFVSITSEKWLSESDFDEEARSGIMNLLSLLAAKAKGMFLYAKVVMDNVQMCHNPEAIQNELRALPETLQDAYARILQRLHELQPAKREMSRRALGWIGCSPIPILIQELAFALDLAPEAEIQLPRNTASLNIVQLCGPVVEVSGDYVHFVHFTVQEYLFSSQSQRFVRILEANIDMARTCLRYLCLDIFDIFDSETGSSRIKEHILSGAYRLYWFAASQLLHILQRCSTLIHNQPLPTSLIQDLSLFYQYRENLSFDRAQIAHKGAAVYSLLEADEFEVFKERLPEEHRFLHNALALRRLDVGKWKLNEDLDDKWKNNDPSTLSEISIQIHGKFEALLCKTPNHLANCACAKLQQYYGKRLFRCHFAICQPQRIAFEKLASREIHCENHDRSYKCSHPACEFYTLGFTSRGQLDTHTEKCHRDTQPRAIQFLPNPDRNELVPLLSDLITLGLTAEVQALIGRFHSLGLLSQRTLLDQAAYYGPLPMVQAIYMACDKDACDRENPRNSILASMAFQSLLGENVEVFEWLSHKFANTCMDQFGEPMTSHLSGCFFSKGANSDSQEIFDLWKNYVSHAMFTGQGYPELIIMTQDFIRSITDPIKQERLAGFWEERIRCGDLTKLQLSLALRLIATTTCSVVLAKVLLERGAEVDFRPDAWNGKESTKKTPLHLASRKMTREAAEMMRLLLLWGADPNADARTIWSHARAKRSDDRNDRPRRTIDMERGTQKIEKWLGMPWEKLVEWAQEQRFESIKQKSISEI